MKMRNTSEAMLATHASAEETKMDTMVYAIDDVTDVAQYIATVATEAGYAAQPISSFKEFTSTFKNQKNAILILDLTMPDKDGVEYMDFLRKQNFTGKIILVSGYNVWTLEMVKRLGDAFKLNIEAALMKPIDTAVLTDMLHNCVVADPN